MTWEEVINKLMIEEPDFSDKYNCYYKDVNIEEVDLIKDPFELCCYTNIKGKMTMLRNQYLNAKSWKEAKKNKANELFISLIGKPKHGSNAKQKHCLRGMTINRTEKTCNVYFRNSDFIKKFPIDLYFINTLLEELKCKNFTINCNFEMVMLRAPFFYIYLQYLYKERGEEEIKRVLKGNNLISNQFIDYYKTMLHKDIKYKSLERCRRRMLNLSSWPLIKDILGMEVN